MSKGDRVHSGVITGVILVLVVVGMVSSATSGVRLRTSLLTKASLKSGRGANLSPCSPTDRACLLAYASGPPSANVSDLVVTAGNKTSLAGVATPFVANLPPGVLGVGYTWWWGNGDVTSSSGNSVAYAYPTPGNYLLYVQALDSTGSLHDNLHALLRFPVLGSAANDLLGNYPQVAGSIVANSTTNVNATGAIAPGGFLSVENWVTVPPTNPSWTVSAPAYSISADAESFARMSASVVNSTGISGVTVVFAPNAPNGSYAINFSLPATGTLNGSASTVWSNFTFTVFLEPGAQVATLRPPASPHPGLLRDFMDNYFVSWDPAVLYDTDDVALVQNVLQTLIFRNESQPGSSPDAYVPNLATCVPGSRLCEALYGRSMVDAQGNYTFVLNPNATFYDGATGGRWQVYPNDVAFSLSRGCLVADWAYPGLGFGGWDLCQTILPGVGAAYDAPNGSWDGGLHYPWNNTPANILSGIVVNASSACPPSSPMRDGVHGNGCVTFVTSRSGSPWPYFIDYLANAWTGILSCSWVTAQGFGLAGWGGGSACLGAPPGSPGNPNAVPGDTAWDANLTQIGSTAYGSSPLRWSLLGSGPYYVAGSVVGNLGPTEVSLKASPVWGGTTCLGGRLAGCLPPGDLATGIPDFVAEATVYASTAISSAAGKAALENGTADLVDLTPSDMPFLVSEVAGGQAQAVVLPSTTLFALGMNLNYSLAAASQALGTNATLPSTLLQDVNLRQFLLNAYPWQSVQRNVCTSEGIQTCFQYSGVIPAQMDGFTPTNLTWPAPNPSANASIVGSAAWWWAKAEGDGIVSAYCTAASPCEFAVPLRYRLGAWNSSMALWMLNVESLSGGALEPLPVTVTLGQIIANLTGPGTSAFAVQSIGWAQDIFDPSNYMGPFLEDQFFGHADGLSELFQPQYLQPCLGSSVDPQVTQGCQGSAYRDLLGLIDQGATCALPSCSTSQRELIYNEADHIALNLGLYVPVYQVESVLAIAPWIDPTSIARDPMTGAMGALGEPLFDVRYLSVVPPVYPLVASVVSGFAAPSDAGVLSVLALSPASSGLTLETGETLFAFLSVAGGSGVYSYLWNGLPTGCISLDSVLLTCAPTGTGSFVMQTGLTDSGGHGQSSAAFPVTVLLGPTITAFSASPTSLPLGSPVTFSLTATGGIGGLRFSFAGLPSGCAADNETTFNCTPSASGTFRVTALVQDGVGVTTRSYASLTITAPSGFPWIPTGIAAGAVVVGSVLAGLHFTRISRETVFQTKVRQVIYEYVQSNPGATFSRIRDTLGLQNGRATYHLAVLEKQGFLHSETLRRRHVYFANGDAALWREPPVSTLQESIIKAVREEPGVGVRDLGRRLGRGATSISYNVRVLTKEGLLRVERDGLRLRCYPANAGDL